jgi:hypothetical protein
LLRRALSVIGIGRRAEATTAALSGVATRAAMRSTSGSASSLSSRA